MKTLSVFLVLCFIPSFLLAQTSIGFSDSTDFKYLINYRLPSWGYSNFSINSGGLGFTGDHRDSNSDLTINNSPDFLFRDNESSSFNADFRLTPQYSTFRESEEYTYRFVSSFFVSTGLNNNNSNSEENNSGIITSNEVDRSNKRFQFGPNVYFESKKYLKGDLFLLTEINANLGYNFNKDKNTVNDDPEITISNIGRNINLMPSLGLGFGRIRNVTPVIRALRVNERYKALGGSSLSQQELEFTSAQFTRFNGYQNSYDRPLKHFWGDLDEGIGNKFSNLDPYDILFLNDVFNENLGSRFEGYLVNIQAFYSYNNQLNRTERTNVQDQRNFSINRSTEVRGTGTWYKNLNLSHQVSTTFTGRVILPLERENDYNWILTSSLNGTWLWVLADRFQMVNQVNTYYTTRKYKDLEDFENRGINSSLSSSFNYFIENRTSLSAGFSINHSHSHVEGDNPDFILNQDSTTNRLRWSLNASIRYYFNRNLF